MIAAEQACAGTTRARADLDWVRGLAALAVAALHCREIAWIGLRRFLAEQDSQGPLDSVLACLGAPIVWGSAGVAVFFVLSGYVIHAVPATRLRASARWRLDAGDFYRRRFVRIYGVLLGALLLTCALDRISASLVPSQVHLGDLSVKAFIGNLLSVQGVGVRHYGSNGPLWTLAIETHFYLAYPLLLMARRSVRPEWLLLSAAGVSLISWLSLRDTGIELFTSYYFCWVLGFYAAEIRADGRWPLSTARAGRLALAAAAVGCVVHFQVPFLAFQCWSIAFFCYLLVLLAEPPKTGPLIRSLAFVGSFSYTLYAVHAPIVLVAVCVLNAGQQSRSMVAVVAALCLVVVASYGMYLLVEKRSIDFLAAARRPRPAPAFPSTQV